MERVIGGRGGGASVCVASVARRGARGSAGLQGPMPPR